MTAIEEIEHHLSQAFVLLEKLKKTDVKKKPAKVDNAMQQAEMYLLKQKSKLK